MEAFGKLEFDVIQLAGTRIYSSEINNALSPFIKQLTFSDFRLHVYEKLTGDKIIYRLVLQVVPKNKNNPEKLKKEISEGVSKSLMITKDHSLSDLIEKNVFAPLKVEFIDMLPFAQKQKSIISHMI